MLINPTIMALDERIAANPDDKLMADAKELLCYMEDMLGVLMRVVDTYDHTDIIPHEEAIDAAANFLKELQQ